VPVRFVAAPSLKKLGTRADLLTPYGPKIQMYSI
jgi:hypothetical protein